MSSGWQLFRCDWVRRLIVIRCNGPILHRTTTEVFSLLAICVGAISDLAALPHPAFYSRHLVLQTFDLFSYQRLPDRDAIGP
ncbi:UNVERIFIED_ORG: hypothetical protein J2W85_004498 [Ensifer adhaerens]|nr:hypothetical protein [Ensifer adhaerens]